MKLRSSFRPRQLLFLALGGWLLLSDAQAQAPQQAVIKLKTGATQQGVIKEVNSSGVAIQLTEARRLLSRSA